MHTIRVVKRCTRFWTQVRIPILHLSFMHHIFTLCFNQLQYLHFLYHQIMLWMLFRSFLCHISYLYMWNYLRSSLVSNWWQRDDLLPIDSNTLPLCHGRLRTCIVICIFIFKFALIFLILNITVCNLVILCITWVQTSYML